ncbi:MAG TPA: adenylate/guanylate cyclase domain-containing protein [Candidatus Dormibacteraeota bacterium]|nr:adenylate/guanylate cyclase domain-containing protein [Candidatus Dormibacteraeota bacterium]
MDVLLSARREMRCIFTRSDPEIRRARWITALTLALANIGGAAITFAIAVLAFPTSAVTSRGIEILAIATGAYMALTLTLGMLTAFRIASEAEAVLTSEDELTPARLRSVLRSQSRHTLYAAAYWLGGAVMEGCLLAFVVGVQPVLVFRGVLTVLLGGLTTCAIAFLLLERGMRPVVARLREVLPEVTACAPSVRSRLLLAWLLGSGIPLVGIVLALLQEQDTDHTRLLILLGALTAAGIFAGAYTSILAAGSVADPLRTLQRIMERVEAGDLSATVPIADSGEIGDLQLRFNRMTAGLRERENLRDLFGRHVGTDVARYAVDNTDLGGELREVSVLFIDIKGSTALAERLSPDRVVAMLNDLFTATVTAVEAEGGWVNKFEGDAALCIFGAPIPQPDHARRALRAARRLSAAVEQLGRRHPGLDAGIGVATGKVVAGNIGSERRYEYTVIGDPVNVAARLCELAKGTPRRVLVDAASVQAAGDEERRCWESRGDVELHGRRRTAAIYAPAAATPSAAPVA